MLMLDSYITIPKIVTGRKFNKASDNKFLFTTGRLSVLESVLLCVCVCVCVCFFMCLCECADLCLKNVACHDVILR